jgi:hypothetical protein
MRKLFLCILFAPGIVLGGNGKEKTAKDSLKPRTAEYRYMGIQANLLLQQFISFNSNASINTNPYIFNFSKNNPVTGKGFVFGTGMSASQHSSNDGVSSVNVDNANFTFRWGYEQKYLQEQRLIPFWGVEFGIGGTYNKVTSRLNQSFNNTFTEVTNTKVFAGPAFRGGLLCAISKHILLGTEFYFNTQVAYTETNGSGVGFEHTVIPFNIGWQAPTALFLIYRY